MKTQKDATPEQDEFLDPSAMAGDPVTQFKSFSIQSVNPYNGNAKPLRNGGFKIPLAQATDPSVLFPIGPKMAMSPMKGEPYEVLGATSFQAYLVGFTPRYNIVYQGNIVKGKPAVVLPNGQWAKIMDAEDKSVTSSKVTMYFILVGDESKKIYRMDVGSTSTPYGTNLVNTVGELAQDYQAWAKKRGKEIGLPASFFVKLTITIPEDPIGLPKGGFITPPVLTWGDLGVKRPSNLEEIKPFIISTAEYNELAEISKRVKEFLASPEAPNYPGFLDATFLEVTGYSQVDGKLIPLNAISAPQSKPMIGINPIPQRKAVSAAKPESLTTSQFLEANSVDDLSALFLKLGVSGDELLTAFNAKDFTELPGSVEDIVQIYNDTK